MSISVAAAFSDRQGREGSSGPARCRRRGRDPDVSAGGAARNHQQPVVHRGEGSNAEPTVVAWRGCDPSSNQAYAAEPLRVTLSIATVGGAERGMFGDPGRERCR